MGLKHTPTPRAQILRQMLEETDYQAIKYAEGAISHEEYEPIRLRRQAYRDEINQLEAGE